MEDSDFGCEPVRQKKARLRLSRVVEEICRLRYPTSMISTSFCAMVSSDFLTYSSVSF